MDNNFFNSLGLNNQEQDQQQLNINFEQLPPQQRLQMMQNINSQRHPQQQNFLLQQQMLLYQQRLQQQNRMNQMSPQLITSSPQLSSPHIQQNMQSIQSLQVKNAINPMMNYTNVNMMMNMVPNQLQNNFQLPNQAYFNNPRVTQMVNQAQFMPNRAFARPKQAPNINIRPHVGTAAGNINITDQTNSVSVTQRPRYELPKGPPLFAIAPQQSTRCFFTQNMHGLVDPPTLLTGYQNTTTVGQKIESAPLYNRDNISDIKPITTTTGLAKRKLHLLLAELDPLETLSPDAEQVSLTNQVSITICRSFYRTEQSWNIRIPGYETQTRPIHKYLPTAAHAAKLTNVMKQRKDEAAVKYYKYAHFEKMHQDLLSAVEMQEKEGEGDIDEEVVEEVEDEVVFVE
ncbi:hypothetical protein HDV01_001838 [Terramyces sp. JEL0728]|nr:hypothetical protein HDV01_001838 [Terramyces sp. JEL0728]